MTKVHFFTPEFPDKDYPATTASEHPQTKLWPAYLPTDNDRLFIFERSKNAQLVVYSANYADRATRTLDPKWPLDINWQSFGWTTQPTSNATGVVERKMAWGYSHTPVAASSDNDAVVTRDCGPGSQFQVTLNALPSRNAHLYFDTTGKLVLQTTIADTASRLLKVYVCTGASRAFVPKVLYVELYGTCVETGSDTYERIALSDQLESFAIVKRKTTFAMSELVASLTRAPVRGKVEEQIHLLEALVPFWVTVVCSDGNEYVQLARSHKYSVVKATLKRAIASS